jgi:hypothetical protein
MAMTCDYCSKGEMVEGTLEGVSFEPASEHKKFFSKGVYGITAMVCLSCGRMSNFSLDVHTLKNIVETDD